MIIDDTLFNIKNLIEDSIRTNGDQGRINLIRSSQPIKLIHELVKQSLVDNHVDPSLIYPPIGHGRGELKLTGLIKSKNQDVCVVNPHLIHQPETLYLTGLNDQYGSLFTEYTLSINVRSQLSSVAKNFDAIYERTFGEAMNLHLRCNRMVLGEVFMIPIREYEPGNTVKYTIHKTKIKNQIEKYIKFYSLINSRTNIESDFYKYERVCLLLVDFSRDIPKVYNTTQELISDNLLHRDSDACMENLSFTNFIEDILKIYYNRFSSNLSDRLP